MTKLTTFAYGAYAYQTMDFQVSASILVEIIVDQVVTYKQLSIHGIHVETVFWGFRHLHMDPLPP
jgi:hypothetical protein